MPENWLDEEYENPLRKSLQIEGKNSMSLSNKYLKFLGFLSCFPPTKYFALFAILIYFCCNYPLWELGHER